MAGSRAGKRAAAGREARPTDHRETSIVNSVLDTSAIASRRETVPVSESSALIQVIERAARDPSIDIVKMKELFAMRKEIVMEAAEAAFNAAMTECQKEMRPISADAENPQTRSKYATYAKLDRALRPIYTKHGFAISYDEADSPKAEHVRVLAYVSHTGGFTRTYRRDMPADGKGAKGGDVMTKTHAVGGAHSYGARYLLKGIWNVAVGEDDRDGNDPKGNLPEAPEGYEKWKADMTALADEGTDALLASWKKSTGMRGYAAIIDAGWWATTKNKAAKVTKAAKQ